MNPLLHYVRHGAAEGRPLTSGLHGTPAAAGAAGAAAPQVLPAAAKHEYAEELVARYEAFLAGDGRIAMPRDGAARISVIVVLHNKAHFSHACLQSLAVAAAARGDIEVVIVDSGSTDSTRRLLSRVDGAQVEILDRNDGFVLSVNRAARLCRGDTIVLLNNDATLAPEAFGYALQTLDEDAQVAAVGGRIVLPGGLLQEAGCIVWADGTTSGYGRGQAPTAGDCMFRRDVDFCSGAFLMIRRSVFQALGGLDERFARPTTKRPTCACASARPGTGWCSTRAWRSCTTSSAVPPRPRPRWRCRRATARALPTSTPASWPAAWTRPPTCWQPAAPTAAGCACCCSTTTCPIRSSAWATRVPTTCCARCTPRAAS